MLQTNGWVQVHQLWSYCSLALSHPHNVKTFTLVLSRVKYLPHAINSYSLYRCHLCDSLNIITICLKPNWLRSGSPLWQAKSHLHSVDHTANSVPFINHLGCPYVFIRKMGNVKKIFLPTRQVLFRPLLLFSHHFKFMVSEIVSRRVSISHHILINFVNSLNKFLFFSNFMTEKRLPCYWLLDEYAGHN